LARLVYNFGLYRKNWANDGLQVVCVVELPHQYPRITEYFAEELATLWVQKFIFFKWVDLGIQK
jgi:hypothetical protein